MNANWDTLVLGSGFGGLAAAAALSRAGHRVLVLGRGAPAGAAARVLGTDGFRVDVGPPALGGFGPGQLNQRLFDTLFGERVKMAPVPGAHDRVHFPGLTVSFDTHAARLRAALEAAFPHERASIARYADALEQADGALVALLAARCAPPLAASAVSWFKRRTLAQWVGRTTRQVLDDCVRDARLRAVLCARRGDSGSVPSAESFALHTIHVRHYLDGAWQPAGGAATVARAFESVVRDAGGAVRAGREVASLRVSAGRVTGVRLADGEEVGAPRVVCAIGLRRTVQLLDAATGDTGWAQGALALAPSTGAVRMRIGFEGDIGTLGASAANDWFYEGWDADALWQDPYEQPRAPGWFVSFPSLRDPAHRPGKPPRHACEIVALVDRGVFGRRETRRPPRAASAAVARAARRGGRGTLAARVESCLLAQFEERFPRLAPLVRAVESDLPASDAARAGPSGAGLSCTPARFDAAALRPRTPVGGLVLAGQDVGTPGAIGAAIGGMMAAVAIEPAFWKWLR
jgi:all-trans-retinol 13,14-reductase